MSVSTSTSNTIPQYYVDVSGMFNIQRNFVGNLLTYTNGNSKVAADASTSVSNQLNTLYGRIIDSNTSSEGILEQQGSMIAMVDAENARLTQKKSDIDNAILGKQRAIQLNESYRLKYQQYTKIMIVIIVTLLLFIGITYLSKRFPILPSFVYEILSILVISIGIFTIYYMTIDMLNRSKTYYDKLNLAPPSGQTSTSQTSQGSQSQSIYDLLAQTNMQICIGSTCCDNGTHWDAGNATCVGNTISAFTTIQQAYSLEKSNKNVKPNTPNEFENYMPV